MLESFIRYLTPFLLLCCTAVTAAVPSENQDIWRVGLHHLAYTDANAVSFETLRYDRLQENQWCPSDAETFFRSFKPEVPLIIFVPGYTSDTPQTSEVGLGIVRTFDPQKACRMVFWDWYSERTMTRIGRDVRCKIPIAQRAAEYMAMFLQRVPPQSKVCLFGFSFGSRIVCNAAEFLRTSGKIPAGLRLHLVLSGAATDYDWFAAGHRHGDVAEIAQKILVTYNPTDWALRFYSLIYGASYRKEALGFTGLPKSRIKEKYRDRFEMLDVSPYIGNQHQTLVYVHSPVFRSRIGEYFFFEPKKEGKIVEK